VKKDEAMRIRYEDRLESERAYETDVRMSRQEGEKLGQEKGERIGLQKEKINSIRMLERLLGRQETSADRLSAFSLDELDRMAADLEQKFQEVRR